MLLLAWSMVESSSFVNPTATWGKCVQKFSCVQVAKLPILPFTKKERKSEGKQEEAKEEKQLHRNCMKWKAVGKEDKCEEERNSKKKWYVLQGKENIFIQSSNSTHFEEPFWTSMEVLFLLNQFWGPKGEKFRKGRRGEGMHSMLRKIDRSSSSFDTPWWRHWVRMSLQATAPPPFRRCNSDTTFQPRQEEALKIFWGMTWDLNLVYPFFWMKITGSYPWTYQLCKPAENCSSCDSVAHKEIIPALIPNSLFVDQSNFMVFEVWASKGWRWWLVVVVPQTMQNDPWRWEKCRQVGTSVKSCEEEHRDDPERTGRQVGDKCEIMQAENPECSRRQLGNKREIMRTKAVRASRVYRETSGRQAWNHAGRESWETTQRQVRNHAGQSTQSIQSVVGDRWETSLKSCGQRTQSVVGDNWETSGRQARNHADRSTQRIQSVFCSKTSPKANAKSCGPSRHPFQRSKNPSQANLFGEQNESKLKDTWGFSLTSLTMQAFKFGRKPRSSGQRGRAARWVDHQGS